MATIVDVARRAGVSVSTVSHVVNRTRHVNADTQSLVEEAIAFGGFQPNALARSLKRAKRRGSPAWSSSRRRSTSPTR